MALARAESVTRELKEMRRDRQGELRIISTATETLLALVNERQLGKPEIK
jgi:hypothetical protein